MAENLKTGSSDTETVEKRLLVLYDLPVHVLGKVAGKLPLIDCMALRNVSRDLRDLVDSSELHCKVMVFRFEKRWTQMVFDELDLTYKEIRDGGCMVTWNRIDTQKKNTYQDDRNLKQVVIADVATFLKNPKLEIDGIGFWGDEKAMKLEFIQFLKSLNFRLNVKSIRSRDLGFLQSIQGFLNPETLEIITRDCRTTVAYFNHIADENSEILKNPKLKFEHIAFNNFSDKSSTKFSEILKKHNSQLNIQSVLIHDGRWIPTIIQSLNSEKVKHVTIGKSCEHIGDHFNAIAEMKQWKTKTRLRECTLPEWVGLEDLLDFKAIQSENFKLSEENLVKIRDILLESPHLHLLELQNSNRHVDFEEEINETIDRIMSDSPEYDASTRRFSIPNSRNYFQLKLEQERNRMWALTIERTSPL